MFKLLSAQIRKLFLRTDVKWILAVFAVLPFGIAALISAESGIIQIGNSVFTAMGYGSVVVGLLNSLLLVSVIVALTTTSVFSKEIDTGLDGMYITKVNSRADILTGKMAAVDLFTFAIFFTLVLSSVCGWFVFLKGSAFGSDIFLSTDNNETFTLIYTVAGSFFETIVMSRVFILFSLLFKYGKAVVFNFVTIVVFKLLANIEKLKLWIPSYIGSGTHLMEYSGDELVHHGLLSIGLLIGYACVLSVVNYFIYRKMDLSR